MKACIFLVLIYRYSVFPSIGPFVHGRPIFMLHRGRDSPFVLREGFWNGTLSVFKFFGGDGALDCGGSCEVCSAEIWLVEAFLSCNGYEATEIMRFAFWRAVFF